jgi:hypothetical protein
MSLRGTKQPHGLRGDCFVPRNGSPDKKRRMQ